MLVDKNFFWKNLSKNHNFAPKPTKNRQKTDKKPTICRFRKFFVSVFVGTEKPTKTDKILSVFRHKTDKIFVGGHPRLNALKIDFYQKILVKYFEKWREAPLCFASPANIIALFILELFLTQKQVLFRMSFFSKPR